jgi:Uma2 family endonuclease
MTTMTLLPRSRPLTYADLEAVPDDGHRYEIVDGTLVVTPAPMWPHQRAVTRLAAALLAACPDNLDVLAAPLDVRLGDDTVLQPDVVVARVSDFVEGRLRGVPVLAVEVHSASTRLVDLPLKRAALERAGCPSYWLVDPDEPSLTVLELRSVLGGPGRYEEVLRLTGAEEATIERPFLVRLAPARLVGPAT